MKAERWQEREREEGETWGGRWNAKLTILLHYLPGGRASVKEKEGKARRDRGEIYRGMQWCSKTRVMCCQ